MYGGFVFCGGFLSPNEKGRLTNGKWEALFCMPSSCSVRREGRREKSLSLTHSLGI